MLVSIGLLVGCGGFEVRKRERGSHREEPVKRQI